MNESPHIRSIAGRLVGPGRPAFVIAEAGVNHDGDISKARQLIDAASAGGADAVKFQVFCAPDLVTANAPTATYQREHAGAHAQREMLAALELDDSALRQVSDHAHAQGIVFLATPFSVRDVPRLTKLDVPAIKIASTDLTHDPLLAAAVDAGLPLIISTGAATREEIARTVEWLRRRGAMDRVILLHCVSAYPTPVEAANLRAVNSLGREFHLPAGFSDHTLSVHTGAWAVCAGACVLEKHLTLDRDAPGPDHAMSLDPALFAEYVREVRSAEAALGTGQLGMQDIEAEVRAVARRSVVAARSIARGTVITADMLTLKRPAGGIDPQRLGELVGRIARMDIQSDTVLTWGLVK